MKLYLRERCKTKGCSFHDKHEKTPKSKRSFCPHCGQKKSTYIMDKWHVTVSRKNAKGKWISSHLPLCESHQESKEKAADRIKEYQEGHKVQASSSVPKGAMTVAEVADLYIVSLEKRLKAGSIAKSTLKKDRSVVKNYVKELWGDAVIADFYHRAYITVRNWRDDQVGTLSNRHLNYIIGVMRCIFDYSIQEIEPALVPANPIRGMNHLSTPDYRMFVLKRHPEDGKELSEIDVLKKTIRERVISRERIYSTKVDQRLPVKDAKNNLYWAKALDLMTFLALNTGLRWGSICSLKKRGELRLAERKIVKVTKHLRTKEVPTRSIVGLTPEVIDRLQEWLLWVDKHFVFPIGAEQHKYVFPAIRYRRKKGDAEVLPHINPKTDLGWKAAMENSGICSTERLGEEGMENINNFHPHDLRHTFATHFLKDNGREAIDTLAKIMGHTNTEITRKYAHVLDDDIHEATANFKGL